MKMVIFFYQKNIDIWRSLIFVGVIWPNILNCNTYRNWHWDFERPENYSNSNYFSTIQALRIEFCF